MAKEIKYLQMLLVKDPQFFSFYRAMQSYEKALIGGDTSLILSPDSDFFKFFGKSGLIKKKLI